MPMAPPMRTTARRMRAIVRPVMFVGAPCAAGGFDEPILGSGCGANVKMLGRRGGGYRRSRRGQDRTPGTSRTSRSGGCRACPRDRYCGREAPPDGKAQPQTSPQADAPRSTVSSRPDPSLAHPLRPLASACAPSPCLPGGPDHRRRALARDVRQTGGTSLASFHDRRPSGVPQCTRLVRAAMAPRGGRKSRREPG